MPIAGEVDEFIKLVTIWNVKSLPAERTVQEPGKADQSET